MALYYWSMQNSTSSLVHWLVPPHRLTTLFLVSKDNITYVCTTISTNNVVLQQRVRNTKWNGSKNIRLSYLHHCSSSLYSCMKCSQDLAMLWYTTIDIMDGILYIKRGDLSIQFLGLYRFHEIISFWVLNYCEKIYTLDSWIDHQGKKSTTLTYQCNLNQ